MAQSYKTAISFGLVYIPITLHACIKSADIGFNMLYKKTGERIKYKKTCENCPANVSADDIVKGYEYEKGKYATLTDAELEKIKSAKDKSVTIDKFVAISEIDPVFFDKSYYVVPTGADNAFLLLLKAMEQENKVGVAKTVLGSKENIVALRVIDGQMILSTLHFYNELQKNPLSKTDGNVKKEELNLALNIIDNMTSEFDISAYKNEYQEKLMAAINAKISGEKIKGKSAAARPKNVINLFDALKKSVAQTEKKTKTKGKKKNADVIKLKKRA